MYSFQNKGTYKIDLKLLEIHVLYSFIWLLIDKASMDY